MMSWSISNWISLSVNPCPSSSCRPYIRTRLVMNSSIGVLHPLHRSMISLKVWSSSKSDAFMSLMTFAKPLRASNWRLDSARELRQAESSRQFEALSGFAKVINDMNASDFELLQTFKLIIDRCRGCNTPIEEFITSLVLMYGLHDDDGQGLTLKDIQFEMDQDIIDDRAMERAIEDAHYMASRYPLPQ